MGKTPDFLRINDICFINFDIVGEIHGQVAWHNKENDLFQMLYVSS